MSSPLPPNVDKCITFIYVDGPANSVVPNGTGFIVALPNRHKPGTSFQFVATAKHVICQTNIGPLLKRIFVRLPQAASGLQMGEIELVATGENRTVFLPENAGDDLALVNIAISNKQYDFLALSTTNISSKKRIQELNITEGTDVFFAGLYMPFLGITVNSPIFRFGKVAMMPKDKINERDLYLIEATTWGGNSGSPVFFYNTAAKEGILLAGVVSGYHGLQSPVVSRKDQGRIQEELVTSSNLGISLVTPAHKLLQLIESPGMQEWMRIKSK